jgi:hypothetical protein
MAKILLQGNGVTIREGKEIDTVDFEFDEEKLSEIDKKIIQTNIENNHIYHIYKTGMIMINKGMNFRPAYHAALMEIYNSKN